MGDSKPRISATKSTHQRAKITKAKLNVTWDEFIQKAAEELDPGDEY